MNDETNEHALTAPGSAAPSDILHILSAAVDRNVPVDTIERLVALKERMDARTAAMDFNLALSAFQSECPPIPKSSSAEITTNSGSKYKYSYAELDQIAKVTRPILTKHGLSYTWDSDVEGDKLVCICTVRHISGHAQAAKFALPTTTKSGMSDQQKVAAALTYARRQSLIQALGLTTTDADTDSAAQAVEKITDDQAKELEALVKASGADLARFLTYMRAPSIADIRARDFTTAKTALQAKAKAQ